MALLPASSPAPQGRGEKALPSAAPSSGQAVTETFGRRNVARWERLVLADPAGLGATQVEYSLDRGQTWAALPAGEDLSALPADRALTFRLTLHAGPEGESPYLSTAAVSYLARVAPVVLENDHAQLRFSGENGALIGIRNKIIGAEYVQEGIETPLFFFVGFRPEFKTVVEIGFGQAELKQVHGPERDALRSAYELMGGGFRRRCG
jgi:hypothetical protein